MTSARLSVEDVVEHGRSLAAAQQPDWADPALIAQVRGELAGLPPLVTSLELAELRTALAEVAAGRAQVIQAGDCAEDPAECTPSHLARKTGLLDALADIMKINSRRPVVRVGRIAGQFGKPRSRPTEVVDGVELPVYRGHMVNDPEPDAQARRPDPKRLLLGYWAASAAMDVLRPVPPRLDAPIWTSHEALLLDYEQPMLRRALDGRLRLASTHWPWIGDRTRQVDGAHVALLAAVTNPVACKVGPTMSADELVAVGEALNPSREPGRLTFIARMGAGRVVTTLPVLVAAARSAGLDPIWLCDPMHGNTVSGPRGRKTRLLPDIVAEIEDFHTVVTAAGGIVGGLHLEVTPAQVAECVTDLSELDDRDANGYTTFCDPRLNPRQAVDVVSSWKG